ncbi:MAG TPA: NEW3 domain-containing protein [Burkholderiales bacterium]
MKTTRLIVLGLLAALAWAAHAQDTDRPSSSSSSYKGIWVSTPFPSFSIQAGEPVTIDLTVHNSGLPPQSVALGVERSAKGWSALFLGEGKRVQSVFVAPGEKASVKLRLEPSGKVGNGPQRFEVLAKGARSSFRLPLELMVGQSFAPRLDLKPELPELRGSPSSEFDFKVAIRNDGGDDATVRIDVQAPEGFRPKITEQYGSQELTSLPLKAGEQKTVSVKITPPSGAKQGRYPVLVRAASGKAEAETQLTMEVSGEPQLELTGTDERLSARATAGTETPIEVLLSNRGSAPAQDVKLDSTAPSGWKVSFQPERIDAIAPNETKTVRALVTPSEKAIAGDYMITLRADGAGASKSSDFRVTVHTSTVWGAVGVLVIAAALVVLVTAMLRFGRR